MAQLKKRACSARNYSEIDPTWDVKGYCFWWVFTLYLLVLLSLALHCAVRLIGAVISFGSVLLSGEIWWSITAILSVIFIAAVLLDVFLSRKALLNWYMIVPLGIVWVFYFPTMCAIQCLLTLIWVALVNLISQTCGGGLVDYQHWSLRWMESEPVDQIAGIAMHWPMMLIERIEARS